MVLLRALALLCAVTTTQAQGMGCQSLLKKVCPSFAANDTEACLGCVEEKWSQLKANCTKKRAGEKCEQGGGGHGPGPPGPPTPTPTPSLPPVPPAPPMPPMPPKAGAPRPHILLFVVDDMGWAAVGYRNPGHVVTPNFDAAAAQGIILDRAYAYRWCSPTRSSLMVRSAPHAPHYWTGTKLSLGIF